MNKKGPPIKHHASGDEMEDVAHDDHAHVGARNLRSGPWSPHDVEETRKVGRSSSRNYFVSN